MELSQESVRDEEVHPAGTDRVAVTEAHRFSAITEGVEPVPDRRRKPRLSDTPDGLTPATSDRRHEPRFPMTASLQVGWVGPDHQMRYGTVRGRNISEGGLGVWASEELPPGGLVNVDLCGCGMSALCRVRYRVAAGEGWNVGLEVIKSFPNDVAEL
jgi:hypothetical protein